MAEKLTHIDAQRMLRYKQGQLTDEEKQAVEKLIAENPFYSEAYEGLSMIGDSKKLETHYSILQHKIAVRSGVKKSAKLFTLNKPIFRLAAAAILLITISAGIYIAISNIPTKNKGVVAVNTTSSDKDNTTPYPKSHAKESAVAGDSNMMNSQPVTPNLQEEKDELFDADKTEMAALKNNAADNTTNQESFEMTATGVVKEDLNAPKTTTWFANDHKYANSDTVVLATRKAEVRQSYKTQNDALAYIKGRVLDADTRLPISGANILTNTNSGITSLSGEFNIPVSKGKNEFVIFYPGYEEESKKFYINDNESKEYTVLLKQSNYAANDNSYKSVSTTGSFDDVSLSKPPSTDINTAHSSFNSGNFSMAAIQYEDVLRESPNSTDALLNCGIAYYNTGKYTEATGKLEKAISKGADENKAKLFLGKVYLKKGNKTQAEKYLNDVKNSTSPYKTEAENLLNNY